jgi:hypothetical protein
MAPGIDWPIIMAVKFAWNSSWFTAPTGAAENPEFFLCLGGEALLGTRPFL